MLRKKLRPYRIILASGSPRRKDLLGRLEIDFETQVRPIDENYPDHLTHSEIPDYLSQLKAEAFPNLAENTILITSDTIVWHDKKALGKPKDTTDATSLLRSLLGKTHEVITSVTFTGKHKQITVHDVTSVSMKNLTDDEIEHYVSVYKPMDKAGAYGIQEWIGYIGVERIEGCFYNVMGLPLRKVYEVLMHWDA